jgi:hypothetical protein
MGHKKRDRGKIMNFESSYGRQTPLLINPHGPGPSKDWMINRDSGPSSSRARFGNRGVSSKGYLSMWTGGHPANTGPSWNPNLRQDQSTFKTERDFPRLGQVLSHFGKRTGRKPKIYL